MSIAASGGFGWGVPGPTAIVSSIEATVGWGAANWGGYLWYYAPIASTATDPTNTPTSILRPGLIMGQNTSTGQWNAYVNSNTDGTQVPLGILTHEINMLDPYTNAAAGRWTGAMLVGGPVKAATLIGLDSNARAVMARRFVFDDDLFGRTYDFRASVAKTANYQVVVADNGTLLIANGSGALTFTLPAIADGLKFSFLNEANQNMIVASTEGGNMIGDNSLTYNDVTFVTSSHKVGGYCTVESIYDAGGNLKWLVGINSASATTVTFS